MLLFFLSLFLCTYCLKDFEAFDDAAEDGALLIQRRQRLHGEHELGVVAVRLGTDRAQQSCVKNIVYHTQSSVVTA